MQKGKETCAEWRCLPPESKVPPSFSSFFLLRFLICNPEMYYDGMYYVRWVEGCSEEPSPGSPQRQEGTNQPVHPGSRGRQQNKTGNKTKGIGKVQRRAGKAGRQGVAGRGEREGESVSLEAAGEAGEPRLPAMQNAQMQNALCRPWSGTNVNQCFPAPPCPCLHSPCSPSPVGKYESSCNEFYQ